MKKQMEIHIRGLSEFTVHQLDELIKLMHGKFAKPSNMNFHLFFHVMTTFQVSKKLI